MIRMIVKGNKKTALSHAEKNGITNVNFEKQVNNGRESILVADDTTENWNKVSLWFVDIAYGLQAPFAPGSLLYYSEGIR